MIKKGLFYSGIIMIISIVSTAFKPLQKETNQLLFTDSNKESLYKFPSTIPIDYISNSLPFTGKYFIGFKEAIGFKESQGKYHKVNSLGYMGKYQFGKETLKTIGITDSTHFLNSPKLQEKAFIALLSKNKSLLKEVIKKYNGKIIDGVLVTESGILAAAHLGGVGSVKKYLNTNGEKKCKDAYGTSIKSYIEQFGGYETHRIIADSNATVK